MKKRKGFTAFELLIVIVVVAILSGLIIPAVFAAREASRKLNNQVPQQAIHGLPSSVDVFKYVDAGHTYIVFTRTGGDLEVLEQK